MSRILLTAKGAEKLQHEIDVVERHLEEWKLKIN